MPWRPSGCCWPRGGSWRRGASIGPAATSRNLAIPGTLTALIASRLDALPADDRALVSDAAVLGQSFTPAGLSAVSGLPESELEPRLHGLVRRELLRLEADPRSPERGQYAFVQALIREVAYNTLAKPDRKRRHLVAARFFETLDTDELAGGLAGHYLAAHANATDPAEADALGHQAKIALVAAAERASALGSSAQALVFLRQALTVTKDESDEAALLELAGDAAAAASDHDAAEALLSRAVESRRAQGDRPAAARATAALAGALLASYRTAHAAATLEAAADEFADLGDDPAFVAVLGQLARASLLTGQDARAVEVADRALAAAERLDLVALVADLLVTKGTAIGNLARQYEGSGLVEAAIRLAERNKLTATLVRARLNFGFLLSKMDPVASLEGERTGLAESRRVGQRRYAILFATNAAADAVWTGDWDWALREMADLCEGNLSAEDRILVLGRIANLRSWRGDAATTETDEIVALAGPEPDPNHTRFLDEARAIRCFVTGRFAEATSLYRDLAALDSGNARLYLAVAARASLLARDPAGAARELDMLARTGVHGAWTEAVRTSIRAGIAALDGHDAESLALYRTALRGLREARTPLDEALTGIEAAALLGPDVAEAVAAAERARGILAGLGAGWAPARLDAATERR